MKKLFFLVMLSFNCIQHPYAQKADIQIAKKPVFLVYFICFQLLSFHYSIFQRL